MTTDAAATQRRAWLIVAMLCGINCMNFLDKASFGLVAVPVMHEFGLSHEAFGLLNSGFFALYTISAAALSWLGDRHSSRWALTVVVALWAIIQLPVALGGVAVLIACRLMLGVAEAPSMPLSLDNLQQWFADKRRALPTMVLYASPAIVGIICIPLLNVLIVHLGWRALFVTMTVLGIIVAAIWATWGRTGPLKLATPTPTASNAPRIAYRKLLPSGTFLGSAVAMFVAQWTMGLSAAWVPAYLEEGLGFSNKLVGPILGAIFIGVAIVMLGYGAISQRLSHRGIGPRGARVWLTAILFAAGAIVLALAATTHNPIGAAVAFGAGVALAQGGFGLGPVLLGQYVPARQRAAVFGFLYTGGALGAIASPYVFGVLIGDAHHTLAGYHHGLLVTAAVFAAAALILAFAVRPQTDAARWRRAR